MRATRSPSAAHPPSRSRSRQAGFEHLPGGAEPSPSSSATLRRGPIPTVGDGRTAWFSRLGPSRRCFRTSTATPSSGVPDIIVRETAEFAGCLVAERLGLPHASVATGSLERPRPDALGGRRCARWLARQARARAGPIGADGVPLPEPGVHATALGRGRPPVHGAVHPVPASPRSPRAASRLAGRAPGSTAGAGEPRNGPSRGGRASSRRSSRRLPVSRSRSWPPSVETRTRPGSAGRRPNVRIEAFVPQLAVLDECGCVHHPWRLQQREGGAVDGDSARRHPDRRGPAVHGRAGRGARPRASGRDRTSARPTSSEPACGTCSRMRPTGRQREPSPPTWLRFPDLDHAVEPARAAGGRSSTDPPMTQRSAHRSHYANSCKTLRLDELRSLAAC